MREHVEELDANMLPAPRIIEVLWGHNGATTLLSTPLWLAGPVWKDRPGVARPSLPTPRSEAPKRISGWDLWLTDYTSACWKRAFGDLPFTLYRGKELCRSPSGPRTARVWDLWLTDYNPAVWKQVYFPFTVNKGARAYVRASAVGRQRGGPARTYVLAPARRQRRADDT